MIYSQEQIVRAATYYGPKPPQNRLETTNSCSTTCLYACMCVCLCIFVCAISIQRSWARVQPGSTKFSQFERVVLACIPFLKRTCIIVSSLEGLKWKFNIIMQFTNVRAQKHSHTHTHTQRVETSWLWTAIQFRYRWIHLVFWIVLSGSS